MSFFLSDFIYLGASFLPKSKPKQISKNEVVVCGELVFGKERLCVSVKTKRGNVPRVDGVVVDKDESVLEAEKIWFRLKQIRSRAMKEDVNGFLGVVRRRGFFSVLLFLELVILLWNSILALCCFVNSGKVIALVFLIVCLFAMKLFYQYRWRIIPYGSLKSVGVKIVECENE